MCWSIEICDFSGVFFLVIYSIIESCILSLFALFFFSKKFHITCFSKEEVIQGLVAIISFRDIILNLLHSDQLAFKHLSVNRVSLFPSSSSHVFIPSEKHPFPHPPLPPLPPPLCSLTSVLLVRGSRGSASWWSSSTVWHWACTSPVRTSTAPRTAARYCRWARRLCPSPGVYVCVFVWCNDEEPKQKIQKVTTAVSRG